MTRQRWLMVAFVISFIVPFVVGHLAYQRGWFEGGSTNKGDLLVPPLALQAQGWQPLPGQPALDGAWWLVYVLPAACDDACVRGLDAMVRLRAGMGRDRGRVGVLVLHAEVQAPELPALSVTPSLLVRGRIDATVAEMLAGQWLIMDPMGWIMLSYRVPEEAQALLLRAQDLIDDLMQLLKVSRIG